MALLLIAAFLMVLFLPFPLWLIGIALVTYKAYDKCKTETSAVKDARTEEPDRIIERDTPFHCSCGSPAYYRDLWSRDAFAHGCIAEFICLKGHIFTRVGETQINPLAK